MTIFACVSQKGGATKSTTLVNIASMLATQGKSPLIFDADEQGTANDWCASRAVNHQNAAKIIIHHQFGESLKEFGTGLQDQIEDLSEDHDHILVDTAGHSSDEMRIVFAISNIVLIPFRCSQADLNTLQYMSDIITEAKKGNPDLKVYACLSAVKIISDDVKPARELISSYPVFTLLKTIIHDRQCYVESISTGLGVVEAIHQPSSNWIDPKNMWASYNLMKAKEEIKSLTKELFNGN
jgi:chromosome partitioning protein